MSPGLIVRWKWKSCSPCTSFISRLTGATSRAAGAIEKKVGTTANTGGATSPFRCAAIGSLVAAA